MVGGSSVRGVVEGDAIPQFFIPPAASVRSCDVDRPLRVARVLRARTFSDRSKR
jgi:hypothetical protein